MCAQATSNVSEGTDTITCIENHKVKCRLRSEFQKRKHWERRTDAASVPCVLRTYFMHPWHRTNAKRIENYCEGRKWRMAYRPDHM
jgi:hypothetical protein